jgi:hypothetical protein
MGDVPLPYGGIPYQLLSQIKGLVFGRRPGHLPNKKLLEIPVDTSAVGCAGH